LRRQVDFGDLKRLAPFCVKWGATRGGAIDRFYIDDFVRNELISTSGSYIECGGKRYRYLLNRSQIATYRVLDKNPHVPELDICADLHCLDVVEDASVDVFICTQVLQYAMDPLQCVFEIHRKLTIGGKFIMSVPLIEKDYRKMDDRWRFTVLTVREILNVFTKAEIVGRGNLFSSICYLLGLGVEDLDPEVLAATDDAHYQVVLAAATK
jgi:Methyltransferase domain